MTLLIAFASSCIVAIAVWAFWPVLRKDMDRHIDMTVVSIVTLAGLMFVSGMTMLAALA